MRLFPALGVIALSTRHMPMAAVILSRAGLDRPQWAQVAAVSTGDPHSRQLSAMLQG